MPFGPLVTLMLLVYILFLGVVMTLWFILSPGRKPDAQENTRESTRRDDNPWRDAPREKLTRAEERSYKNSARVYADPNNDQIRGTNVRAHSARDAKTRDAGTEDAGKRTRDDSAERTPTRSTATSKKRKSDAFEDFIRSKNDDFEF